MSSHTFNILSLIIMSILVAMARQVQYLSLWQQAQHFACFRVRGSKLHQETGNSQGRRGEPPEIYSRASAISGRVRPACPESAPCPDVKHMIGQDDVLDRRHLLDDVGQLGPLEGIWHGGNQYLCVKSSERSKGLASPQEGGESRCIRRYNKVCKTLSLLVSAGLNSCRINWQEVNAPVGQR
jgi:hypothetical protein